MKGPDGDIVKSVLFRTLFEQKMISCALLITSVVLN